MIHHHTKIDGQTLHDSPVFTCEFPVLEENLLRKIIDKTVFSTPIPIGSVSVGFENCDSPGLLFFGSWTDGPLLRDATRRERSSSRDQSAAFLLEWPLAFNMQHLCINFLFLHTTVHGSKPKSCFSIYGWSCGTNSRLVALHIFLRPREPLSEKRGIKLFRPQLFISEELFYPNNATQDNIQPKPT